MIMILDSDQNHQSIEFWWFLLVRVSWTRWGLRSWQWLQHKNGASLSILIWDVQQGAVATMTWIQNFHYASHPVSERNSLTKEHISMCGILYPEKKLVWSYYTVLRYHQSRSNGSSASAGRSPRRWRISDIVFRQVSQGSRAQGTHGGGESAIKTRRGNSWPVEFPKCMAIILYWVFGTSCKWFCTSKINTTSQKNRPPAADWNLEAPKCNKEMIPLGMQGNEWYIEIQSDIIFQQSPINCTRIYQTFQITFNVFQLHLPHHSIFIFDSANRNSWYTYK